MALKTAEWSENAQKLRYQCRKCRIRILPLRVAARFFDAFPDVFPAVLRPADAEILCVGNRPCRIARSRQTKRAFRLHGRNALYYTQLMVLRHGCPSQAIPYRIIVRVWIRWCDRRMGSRYPSMCRRRGPQGHARHGGASTRRRHATAGQEGLTRRTNGLTWCSVLNLGMSLLWFLLSGRHQKVATMKE
jgi:hypothetical protein